MNNTPTPDIYRAEEDLAEIARQSKLARRRDQYAAKRNAKVKTLLNEMIVKAKAREAQQAEREARWERFEVEEGCADDHLLR